MKASAASCALPLLAAVVHVKTGRVVPGANCESSLFGLWQPAMPLNVS